jgi:hypothetical protein
VPFATEPIDVVARVVFEQDGGRWVRGLAVGWTKELVMFELAEPDSDTITVRLYPEDVKRAAG